MTCNRPAVKKLLFLCNKCLRHRHTLAKICTTDRGCGWEDCLNQQKLKVLVPTLRRIWVFLHVLMIHSCHERFGTVSRSLTWQQCNPSGETSELGPLKVLVLAAGRLRL